MRPALSAVLVAALFSTAVNAAGVARNENFSVYVPNTSTKGQAEQYAKKLLDRAQKYRREIATEWFGENLPTGAGKSTIYVEFSNVEDRGLTWAKDNADRHAHTIWLHTTPRLAIGETLKHEVAHAVFATKYPHPNRLPSWLEEGIASRYDDEVRKDAREQLFRSWVRTGRTVSLAQLLQSRSLRSFDEDSYAAATSLVNFLLTQGDPSTLLRFAEDGQRSGWTAASRSHYGFQSLQELQLHWQAWLADNIAV